MTEIHRDDADAFIAKWRGVTASELSTAQSFALDLCHLLGVEAPHPDAEQRYMFERPVTFAHGDGSTSAGRIDLYKRDCFVLEAKKLKAAAHTKGFDEGLLRARSQAEQYARALPASEGRPPFLIVLDVGNRIELYAEFSRSGATYTPFPDPSHHRLTLDDLRREPIRERLRKVWTQPLSLDPSRESARVTREIAAQLAELAKSLEHSGHAADAVAQFLMRCLFTMFAEDVKLLPHESFRNLLLQYADRPDVAMRMLAQLWRDMDGGGFSTAIACDVLRFNGKLFKQPDTLPLSGAQITLLIAAAKAKWEHVEPAIFGTLLERALDTTERHKLGAHYTPRAYVERLVLPTVIEPLRSEWSDAHAAALVKAAEAVELEQQIAALPAKAKAHKNLAQRLRDTQADAVTIVRDFHHRLCTVRVLDPACGSGNFLYVTLEHLKRLEGEVLNALDELGFRQTGLALGGERADAMGGETVDPHQLLGIELNPRAAAIAEVVLWIGYLQWHYRTHGDINPPQPVVRDFRNIENRDAVLAYDAMEYVADEHGVPVSRWDGISMKPSPVTGEDVPDDSKRVPLERYVNPRKAAWPEADFVVGNPPFIGAKYIRDALGDGYAEALRATWPEVPESADFVMYWWHHAAVLTRHGALERFGFITTNSIRQTFNRRVIEAALSPSACVQGEVGRGLRPPATKSKAPHPNPPLQAEEGAKTQPLSLVFAIPDHPWVDSADGAAVRIAMTVSAPGAVEGQLCLVESETDGQQDEIAITLRNRTGLIHADLSIGANVTSAQTLRANAGISCPGLKLHGAGFLLKLEEARQLGLGVVAGLEKHIRPYRNGRDLTDKPREVLVIDLFGLTAENVRSRFPAVYQHVLERVKPERDQNSRATYKNNWWIHGEPRSSFRPALKSLSRYIVTAVTAKHRAFQFLGDDLLADDALMCFALEDAQFLGVLSSCVHVTWALAAGGRLGVGNDPRYNKSRCFEPFPFPITTDVQQTHLRNLAEQLDAHRKRQQAAHPDLTLTGMYNVLEKLRSGEPLSAKERVIHEHGLVSVLRQLHDEIDAAVLEAYGWSDLLPLLRVAHGNDAAAVVGAALLDPTESIAAEAAPTRAAALLDPTESIAGEVAAARCPSGEGRSRTGCAPTSAATGREEARRAFDEAILERLVALNAERAAEEARGLVRWLRPEFQHPTAPTPTQQDLPEDAPAAALPAAAAKAKAWPKDTVAQVRAVADALTESPLPQSLDELAAGFSGRGPWKKRLPQLLEMLVALGRATEQDGRYMGAR